MKGEKKMTVEEYCIYLVKKKLQMFAELEGIIAEYYFVQTFNQEELDIYLKDEILK